MPNLSIKNVPGHLLDKLRDRAARHHRSIQGELMALLSDALEAPAKINDPVERPEAPPMRRSGTRRIEEVAAEHRQQWKKPFAKEPRAVDMIRAERDAR